MARLTMMDDAADDDDLSVPSSYATALPSTIYIQGEVPSPTPAPERRPGKAVKTSGMKLFSGNANSKLAAEIAGQLGMNLGKITVSRFADGEVNVMVHENVRGKDVYIVQVSVVRSDIDAMEEGWHGYGRRIGS